MNDKKINKRTKSKDNIENTTILSLSTETVGVVAGNLFRGGGRLLSMTHPATIAAAIFAMGECKVVLLTNTEAVQFPFPISVADMCAVQRLIDDADEADFLWGLAKASWFDFHNPHPADNRARPQFHLMEAVSHLPEFLVRNGQPPTEPKGFTEKPKMGERRSPFAPD